jgi:hypothetical protein
MHGNSLSHTHTFITYYNYHPFFKNKYMQWKESEMTSGEIVIDPEFRVVLLTSHAPWEVLKELSTNIPMEHVAPVVVLHG